MMFPPVRNPAFLTPSAAPQGEVRLLSTFDMLRACDAFLALSSCRIKERWIPSEDYRNELARLLKQSCPDKWTEHGEWTALIQREYQNVFRNCVYYRTSESAYWNTKEELESDIHNSILASKPTVLLFSEGKMEAAPARTDVFAVQDNMGDFLGSLLAGKINPVWIMTADTEKTLRNQSETFLGSMSSF